MKKSVIARVLALIGLCALAVPIMGGGTECPKKCVVEDASCETKCNEGLDGVCLRQGGVLQCVKPHGGGAAPETGAKSNK